MNNLFNKLKQEIVSQPFHKDIDVKSYYNYKLDPIVFNHLKDFKEKYDDKPAFVVKTSYNGNKYNLERKPIDHTIHYRSKQFIPDSYYEFNLKNTDHKQMMKNNIETENDISNDFNIRTRQAESGQTIQEIKTEDQERAENLKLLLEQYNKVYDDYDANNILFYDELPNKKNAVSDKLKELDNKYHKPVINKAVEDVAFDKNVNTMKKILKGKLTNDEIIHGKKIFYRLKNNDHKKEFNDGITDNIDKFNEALLKDEETAKINKNKELPIKRRGRPAAKQHDYETPEQYNARLLRNEKSTKKSRLVSQGTKLMKRYTNLFGNRPQKQELQKN